MPLEWKGVDSQTLQHVLLRKGRCYQVLTCLGLQSGVCVRVCAYVCVCCLALEHKVMFL